jgi:hypothetical protein
VNPYTPNHEPFFIVTFGYVLSIMVLFIIDVCNACNVGLMVESLSNTLYLDFGAYNCLLPSLTIVPCSVAIKHNPNPFYPNQSLESDSDTINDLHTLVSVFRKSVIVDESKQATASHQSILQTVSFLVQHTNPDYSNKNICTHPQLRVRNKIIANQHVRTIRTQSSKKEVQQYLM